MRKTFASVDKLMGNLRASVEPRQVTFDFCPKNIVVK